MSPADLIPPQYRALAVAGLLAAVAGLGFAGGWTVNGWRLGSALATAKTQAAEDKAKALAATVKQRDEAIAERDRTARQLADVDKTATDNLRRLTDENDRLRARVRAGSVVVRVPGAVCPERAADVPQAPAGSGVDSGTGAVLTPAAGQDFLDLRAAVIRAQGKLDACQQSLGRMTGQLP
jgi:hypothetical protein